MKRYTLVTSIALLFCVLATTQTKAEDSAALRKLNISVPLKLQIFEDGKATDHYIVGTLGIFDFKGKLAIFWEDVFISPLHSQKIVLLKPEHYNTTDDVFEDVVVREDSFSFTMVLMPGANRMKISGHKKPQEMYHSIGGEGLFSGIYPGDRPTKVEWRQVDKVVLPYREVY
jgi:hypothetical protein